MAASEAEQQLSTLEDLALASCVMRHGEDWPTVMKNLNAIVTRDRRTNPEPFLAKTLASAYTRLTEGMAVPKRRRTEGGSSAEPLAGQMVSKLTLQHISDLKKVVDDDKAKIAQLRSRLSELEKEKSRLLEADVAKEQKAALSATPRSSKRTPKASPKLPDDVPPAASDGQSSSSPGREKIILKISTKKGEASTSGSPEKSEAPATPERTKKEEQPTPSATVTPSRGKGRGSKSKRQAAQTDFPSNFPSAEAYKVWKRQILMVWRTTAGHRHANIFAHPVTEDIAPGYHSIVYKPTDLSSIKKSVETGALTTTSEFQELLLLMFVNAIMYNNADHDVHKMALEMAIDVMKYMNDLLPAEGPSPLHPVAIPYALQMVVSKSTGQSAAVPQHKSLRSRAGRSSATATPSTPTPTSVPETGSDASDEKSGRKRKLSSSDDDEPMQTAKRRKD